MVETVLLTLTRTASVTMWTTVLVHTTIVEYVTVLALSTSVDVRTFQMEHVIVMATFLTH